MECWNGREEWTDGERGGRGGGETVLFNTYGHPACQNCDKDCSFAHIK